MRGSLSRTQNVPPSSRGGFQDKRVSQIDRAYFEGCEFVPDSGAGESFVERRCSVCRDVCQDYPSTPEPVCYDCSRERNPFAAKNVRMSVDASCDDSTNPARVKEGTADKNMGLPSVPGDPIGRDAYGQMRRTRRPVSNNEIASARRLKEMAKRAGLSPLETAKRAVG